jgi:large subunit ribosomal protein L3
MTIGLVGRKRGMTRIYTEGGESVPVTVVQVLPNRVTQLKTAETDGYRAVQVSYGERRPQLLTKALAGHYAKANSVPGKALHEFRLAANDSSDLKLGSELKVDMFSAGQLVDVSGVTIGKGFAGTMKRHNFGGHHATHGVSLAHRTPGSIGQRQTPGRVFPGKRMSGHMGGITRTTEKMKVVSIDAERNLILIKGAVPGSKGGEVVVRPSTKGLRLAKRKKVMPTKAAAPVKGAPAAKAPAAKAAAPAKK